MATTRSTPLAVSTVSVAAAPAASCCWLGEPATGTGTTVIPDGTVTTIDELGGVTAVASVAGRGDDAPWTTADAEAPVSVTPSEINNAVRVLMART
jgi:hypothetical protein